MNNLSLFEKVLSSDFAKLPPAVQRFHRLSGDVTLHGQAETLAPETPLAWALAVCLGAPRRASRGAIQFELSAAPTVETWTRRFPTISMTSRLALCGDHVEEKLGLARLTFRVSATEEQLSMQLEKMRFLGVPCPRWLLPRIVAEERGTDDQLHFNISAELPVAGKVASYTGHLDIPRRGSE